VVIPIFIGSFFGRFVAPRVFGREWWNKYRAVVVAGFAGGEGIAVGIGIVSSLLTKSVWAWPY